MVNTLFIIIIKYSTESMKSRELYSVLKNESIVWMRSGFMILRSKIPEGKIVLREAPWRLAMRLWKDYLTLLILLLPRTVGLRRSWLKK